MNFISLIENGGLQMMSLLEKESGCRRLTDNSRNRGARAGGALGVCLSRPAALKRPVGVVLAAGMAVLLAVAPPARATVTYVTEDFAGSSNGGSTTDDMTVSGNASFVVGSNGTITLTLTNTSPETKSSNELLTGLDFTVTYDGKTLTNALTYSTATATPVTVKSNGTYTDGTPGTSIKSAWEEERSGSAYQLDFLLGNKYAIIGPPDSKTKLYNDANSTIYSGNSATNPFTADAATYTFTDSLITNPSELSITGVTFLYDTGCTYSCSGQPVSVVPERGAAIVFALGLTLVCLFCHFSIFSKWRVCGGGMEV